jgi:hypothetical protein
MNLYQILIQSLELQLVLKSLHYSED